MSCRLRFDQGQIARGMCHTSENPSLPFARWAHRLNIIQPWCTFVSVTEVQYRDTNPAINAIWLRSPVLERYKHREQCTNRVAVPYQSIPVTC